MQVQGTPSAEYRWATPRPMSRDGRGNSATMPGSPISPHFLRDFRRIVPPAHTPAEATIALRYRLLTSAPGRPREASRGRRGVACPDNSVADRGRDRRLAADLLAGGRQPGEIAPFPPPLVCLRRKFHDRSGFVRVGRGDSLRSHLREVSLTRFAPLRAFLRGRKRDLQNLLEREAAARFRSNLSRSQRTTGTLFGGMRS